MKFYHGGDLVSYAEKHGGEKALDFSSNVNPFGITNGIADAAEAAIDELSIYPDPYCRELRTALSGKYGLPADWFYCGNGAADVIYRIAAAVKPLSALVTAPTFSEYEASLEAAVPDCSVKRFTLNESEGFRVTDSILEEIDAEDTVYICNPNNPTGVLTSVELLLEIAGKCKLLVADECFIEFTEEQPTLLPYLAEFPNVMVLRSFTKMFAIPGVRLGYCVCSDNELIDKLYSSGPPWNVSAFAQKIGAAAAADTDYIEDKVRKYIAKQRGFLTMCFKNIGLTVVESSANYLLIKSEHDLQAGLESKGILIRSCDDYSGLSPGYYRIAIRREEENLRLIAAIMEIKGKKKWLRQ
ncbi:MAG: aminotransferase class I/II-fold pyridoxal phosphate-dependent enzyme [Oscillospiraceae bacterium]|jgi:threonine-phosphate decarboxylase|nr:aminotransferase class I/II-fold pyridoxal phosphate-dependent enzyme [Oscillospiraceae bacterium]